MKVEGALAREIVRQGTHAAFVLLSEDILRLVLGLSTAGMRLYHARHEAAAVGMADGYARATGTPGVAIIGRGPGFTNALTAILTASRGGTSVVVLTGDGPVGAGGGHRQKSLSQASILDDMGVRHVTLRSPSSAVADLAGVFAAARAGATIVVNLPTDVLEGDAGDAASSLDWPPPRPTNPDPRELSAVADLLETAWAVKRPVILAGAGAVKAGAGTELRGLAGRSGALLATTLKARSLFRGDPYDIGIAGTYSTPLATELLTQADLVLAFGASLNERTTYDGSLLRGARVVHVDVDEKAFGRHRTAELTVRGDARISAAGITAELERRGHRSIGWRTPEVAARIAGSSDEPFSDRSVPGALDPRSLMARMDGILPSDRTIVQDGAYSQRFSSFYLSASEPGAFILPRENGAVGSAAYVALGVAVARADRLTVLCIGDGGFMMTLSDFDTAVRYKLRLLVLVSNNSGFGAEVLYLREWGLPEEIAYYENPSLEAVARGLGASALTVASLPDIDRLPAMLAAMDGPLLVDCKVSLDVPFHR